MKYNCYACDRQTDRQTSKVCPFSVNKMFNSTTVSFHRYGGAFCVFKGVSTKTVLIYGVFV